MKIMADVSVSDVMDALELSELPEGCPYDPSGNIEMTVDIDEDEVKPDEPDPLDLHDVLDRDTVMDLTAAIRRGDTSEAELMLDRLLGEDGDVKHWIETARYSRKARRPEAVEVRAAA